MPNTMSDRQREEFNGPPVEPLDPYWLTVHDGWNLGHLATIDGKGLYRHHTEACVWATFDADGKVTELRTVEGPEAAALIAEHAWRLLPETRNPLVEALDRIPIFEDAIRPILGAKGQDPHFRWAAVQALEHKEAGRTRLLWVVNDPGPYWRKAALEAYVDDEGRTLSWRLVEGPEGRKLVVDAAGEPGAVTLTR